MFPPEETWEPLGVPVALVTPEADPDGAEPVVFESEAWDCEVDPDAPGVVEPPGAPVGVPVALLPPGADSDGAEPVVSESEA